MVFFCEKIFLKKTQMDIWPIKKLEKMKHGYKANQSNRFVRFHLCYTIFSRDLHSLIEGPWLHTVIDYIILVLKTSKFVWNLKIPFQVLNFKNITIMTQLYFYWCFLV